MLLDHGANTDTEDDQGGTPLHAVSHGTHNSQECGVSIARLLLEQGVDVNAQMKDKATPLHMVAFSGNVELARVLLDLGADAHAVDELGETPLHRVSHREYDSQEDGIRIARLLLERGVDVNTPSKTNYTPLHTAAFNGRLEIAQVLLDHDASANEKDDLGETPLHKVSRGEYESQDNGVGIARLLLKHNVDVHAPNIDNNTALHLAALCGRLEISQVLLDNGASPNVENEWGETPLHVAARGEYDFQEDGVGNAQPLLKQGLDVGPQVRQVLCFVLK